MSKAEHKQSTLHEIAEQFSSNMVAMRHFAENLGPLADKHDNTAFRTRLREFLGQIGVPPPPELDAESGPIEVEVKVIGTEEPANASTATPEGTAVRVPMDRLSAASSAFNRRRTSHGRILRTSGLIQAVCMLDALIADLLKVHYTLHPHTLDGEDGKITFKDLCTIGSVETAREIVLEQKIDSILRSSLPSQLGSFSQTLKVDLAYLQQWIPRLNETVQRRHLWVHNSGRVSKLYLARVQKNLIEEVGAKENEKLPIDQTYLRRAIDRVNLAGVVLSQQCWRQWAGKERENADNSLNGNIFDTICDQRYVAAQFLGKYACEVVSSSDATKKNAIINYAQSLKWSGKNDEAKQFVNRYDWTASALRYRAAVAAIKDDIPTAKTLVRISIEAKDLTIDNIREWPVFREIRKDQDVLRFLQSGSW